MRRTREVIGALSLALRGNAMIAAGAVPFSLVGTHRRIKFADLLAYKRARDADRRAILDELSVEGQEQDLG